MCKEDKMDERLRTMDMIQREKEKDIARDGIPPLDPEGETVAKHKRFTFDIIDTPVDPLR